MNWWNIAERALQTAWQAFLAAWPVGAAFTDLSAWKIAGAAAASAAIAAVLSAVKTYAQEKGWIGAR